MSVGHANSLWKSSLRKILLVLIIAILISFLQIVQEIPLTIINDDSSNGSDEEKKIYNVVDIRAPPCITGPLVHVASYIFTRSFLSPFLLRSLLNKNGLHLVRELSANEECIHLPPTFFPVHTRSSTKDLYSTSELHQKFLQTGIELNNDNGDNRPSSSTSHDNKQNAKTNRRSIMDYHNLYKSRKAIPSEVMEEFIVGVERLKHLRIFSSYLPEDIRKQALQSDERWKKGKPLSVFDGVPVAAKDMLRVRGHRICEGSKTCIDIAPGEEEDIPIRRLRKAGAIYVGVTVMVEGGVTPLGYSVHFDGPFNAYDTDYYSGGSSSGSAVAVSSGLVPMALGFDGGGSVRIPAAASGVVGLAGTHGRFPYNTTTLVTKMGPIATTLEDVALSLLLLGKNEPGSLYDNLSGGQIVNGKHHNSNIPPPHLLGVVDKNGKSAQNDSKGLSPLKGTRLGIFWDYFQHTDPEVYRKCLQSVNYLKSLGAELVNITIPHLREMQLSHMMTILTEFGVKWERPFYDPRSSHSLEANTQLTVALGRTIKAGEVFASSKVRTYGIQKVCKELFQELRLDAILSPAMGSKVPKLPSEQYRRGYGEIDNAKVFKFMRYVSLANFLGLPGLAQPIGYEDETGLPIGLQLLGDAWSEHTLIRIGRYLEEKHHEEQRLPPSKNFHDVLGKFLN